MTKYWIVFKNRIGTIFAYRLNFFIGRLQGLIMILLLYFLWVTLAKQTGRFAGFTPEEIATYVLLVNILRAFVFGNQTRLMASDINKGTFSVNLVKPFSSVSYYYFHELAERVIGTLAAIAETLVLTYLLKINWVIPNGYTVWIYFTLATILAQLIYFSFSTLLNYLAFWSREAMGPRFLFEWILEFASGAYFPLTILMGGVFFSILYKLPFIYMIYHPIMIFLQKGPGSDMPVVVYGGIIWLVILIILNRIMFNFGIKRYTSEGI
ncbi:MAG TPA: ABC-2 family transporter protein [Patescibacteria group bacterium]|nr:ABC-2 family transporter protein [Patescibacteria group bacterium]